MGMACYRVFVCALQAHDLAKVTSNCQESSLQEGWSSGSILQEVY